MKNDKKINLQRKIYKEFFVRILLFCTGYLFLIFLGYYVFSSFISMVLHTIFSYEIASGVISLIFILAPIGLISGILLIIYLSISKAIGYSGALMDSMGTLFSKEDLYITLPEDLKELETSLNQMKHDSLKNEQSAKVAEQRKNDLVVYLAHDIRTPLTSVIGYLSLLEEAKNMPQLQKEQYTKIALEKAHNLEELVNEFFEITRYNFQSVVLEKEMINLSLMLQQIADEFYPILEEHKRKITLNVPEEICFYADPNKLGRVFNNIVKNAISYSDEESIIEVVAVSVMGGVTIRIKNTGREIPPEKLENIFEKFFRVSEARSSNTGGAGLGLAIAKEIVERHDGTIKAESKNGITVFTVFLPNKK